MGRLKKQYRDLEARVLHLLREKVMQSTYKSKNFCTKAVKINLNDKVELLIINDSLEFLGEDGLLYNVFTEDLEDLIDLLPEIFTK